MIRYFLALLLAAFALSGNAATWTAGDFVPRGNPDNQIDIGDVVAALQAAVGTAGLNDHELLLADVAPSRIVPLGDGAETVAYVEGDGRVSIADVVLLLRAAVGLSHIRWEFHEIPVVATRSADVWGWQAEFTGLKAWHSDGGAAFFGSPEELALTNSTFGPPARMLVAYSDARHVVCGDRLGALIVHSPFPISSTDAEISAEVIYDVGSGGIDDGLLIGVPENGAVNCPPDQGGRFWVSESSATAPLEAVVAGDEIKLGVLRFHNECREDIFLDRVGLELTTGSPGTLDNVTLWHENTLLGKAFFVGANTTTTMVFQEPWKLESCSDTDLLIHAELAYVNPTAPGEVGPLVVNYDGDRREETRGVGGDTGLMITSSSHEDSALPGVVVFEGLVSLDRTFPAPQIRSYGTLAGFQMSARGTDATIEKISFLVQQIGLEVGDDFEIIDQNGNVIVGDSPTVTPGENGSLRVEFNVSFVIPQGTSRTFNLRAGAISGLTAEATETLVVRFLGDKERPENFVGTYNEFAISDFVWGATSGVLDWDDERWSNGHLVPGLLGSPPVVIYH